MDFRVKGIFLELEDWLYGLFQVDIVQGESCCQDHKHVDIHG